MKKIQLILIFLFSCTLLPYSQQQKYEEIQFRFDELAKMQPGLNEKVEVSISGVALSDFINTIASEHNLNVTVESELNFIIVSNFYDALVKDVFLFLIKKHNLTVEFTGTIISFKSTPYEVEKPKKYEPKPINISYRKDNTFLSLDLKNDSLDRVVEEITRKSGNNVVLAPNVKDRVVSVYIENRPFDSAIEMMCRSNGLSVYKDANGFYFIHKDTESNSTSNNNASGSRPNNNSNKGGSQSGNFKIALGANNKIDVEANNVPIKTIIEEASVLLGEHYFMYNVPDGNATLSVINVTFEDLLTNILKGSEYTFKKNDNYYIIGNRNTEGLRSFALIQLENRSIETVKDLIPAELIKGIKLNEFVELNGFVAYGSYIQIEELKSFIKTIDLVVPMVQIDVIIAFSGKSASLRTGIRSGIGDQPVNTSGDIFPALDVTMGAQTINGLINSFNGFGLINLGLVTPEFYLSLKALETNSIIELKSTPKISTLNGHEATLSVGETDYYQEERVTYNNTINGGNIGQNRVFKATEANLSIRVKPFVSADEYVTLEIKVEQSDFKPRTDPNAPPGKTTQTFESLIRVKNGEMILMGGLDKKKKSDAGSGTPFLSRVPVLKWFFSSREKDKEKSKLHIFIKPTVTY